MYLNGMCHEFALALQRRLPGSVIWCYYDGPYASDEWYIHSYLKYNGKYYDINGPNDIGVNVILYQRPPSDYVKFTGLGKAYNETIVQVYMQEWGLL